MSSPLQTKNVFLALIVVVPLVLYAGYVFVLRPSVSFSGTAPRPWTDINERSQAFLRSLTVNRTVNLSRTDVPNIIFMMADDLGYGDVRYNGGKADTPNLDAMAAGPNSIHLTRYYAGAPVCSPTRGSVLTGRNPNRYCIWAPNTMFKKPDFTVATRWPLPPSEITIAEILKELGYHTAVFGKWHIGDLKPVRNGHKKWPVSHPGMHGFNEWWVTPGTAPTLHANCACFKESKTHCPKGHYPKPLSSCMNYYTKDPITKKLKAWPAPVSGDDSMFLYERLSSYLRSIAESERPFFVYLPFHTVHHSYIATNKYRDTYLARNYTLHQADYYGAISAMDEAVGLIRSLLLELNLHENTMLWFTSDNGPERNTPGVTAGLRGQKYTIREGGIRVPGIIQWPAVIKENRKSDFPVVSSDLLPTVCDIIGVDPPMDRPIDGTSILPFLHGKTTVRNTSILWEYNAFQSFDTTQFYAVTRGQYKMFAKVSEGKIVTAELYDVVNEPSETKDIKKEHLSLWRSMKAEIAEWRKSVIRSATREVKCRKY